MMGSQSNPDTEDGLFLCVDAGGTKTVAVICDATGAVVGQGRAGGANMAELGVETAAYEVLKAVFQAVFQLQVDDQAGSSSSSAPVCQKGWTSPVAFLTATCGMSGCDSPVDAKIMTARLQRHFVSPFQVFNDGLLLSSALLDHPETSWAIALVAGTGSIVLGLATGPPVPPEPSDRHTSGHRQNDAHLFERTPRMFAKRGGLGHLFGDIGSGYHIGLTAIRLAVEEYDLGLERQGGLAQALREEYGVKHTDEIPSRVHDVPLEMDSVSASNARKLRIASLCPLVFSLLPSSHSSGDPLAARVLHAVTDQTAAEIQVVLRQAKQLGLYTLGRPGLVITGGAGVEDVYVAALSERLKQRGEEMQWIERVRDAAQDGAKGLAKSARRRLDSNQASHISSSGSNRVIHGSGSGSREREHGHPIMARPGTESIVVHAR